MNLPPKFPNSRGHVSHLRTHSSGGNYISNFRTFVGNVILSTFLNTPRENIVVAVRLLPVSVLAYLREQMPYLDI